MHSPAIATIGKRPFDDSPGFYQEDNRQYRGSNPIKKSTLEAKMSALLPEWLIKGKTILDLGACLGAAGQWALFYGAKSYTGVEVQTLYAATANRLLAHWGEHAVVFETDIRRYLQQAADQSYDIVIAAGVIYHFIDPKMIVDECCRVAKEMVVIESNHPTCVKTGAVSPYAYVTEYSFDQDANLAGGKESLSGLAACSTISVLDMFFRLNAFDKTEDTISFPVSADTVVYTQPSTPTVGVPIRYVARYIRNPGMPPLKTLEENLPEAKGIRKSWATDPAHLNSTAVNRRAALELDATFKKWEFNEEVAKSFAKIAETSIPHYHQVLDKTIQIIKQRGNLNSKIIDVGSATGITLKKLHDNGFKNIYGVDSSAAMLEHSFKQATLIHSEKFPTEHGPFDVIIANWVLHFIGGREAYLQLIRESLSNRGMLILSEKVASSAFTHDLYHEFKLKNGLTETEIEQKQKQLIGVLTPYPIGWYFDVLKSLGFKHVDVIDADFAFVTFLAQL